MSSLSDFFKGIDGSLLKPKFQDFTASGNFTPTQALVDGGGYIEVFLVGGGASSNTATSVGGGGGEVLVKKMYLSNTNPITVSIGDGGTSGGNAGTGSIFSGSQAGGVDLFASGGLVNGVQENMMGAGWGSRVVNLDFSFTAGSGVLGYGAGAAYNSDRAGVSLGKPNSGQGGQNGGGSGFCSVTWFE